MPTPVMSPPFGEAATRRVPEAAEQSQGFPCGPIDQSLLNYMFWLPQAEMRSVMDSAAITTDVSATDNLNRAIDAKIASKIPDATDTSGFPTLDALRSVLPFYPHISAFEGKLTFSTPSAGTVRLNGGQSFVHRGVYTVSVVETDFATEASKTYHIRWRKATGWGIFDVSDAAYSSGVAENDVSLDTQFDDLLAARVVTSAANIATVTPLASSVTMRGTSTAFGLNPRDAGRSGARFDLTWDWNWSRRPIGISVSPTRIDYAQGASGMDRAIYRIGDYGGEIQAMVPYDRYGARCTWMEHFTNSLTVAAITSA